MASMADLTEVPGAITRMIEATNAADSDAFVACFTEDAYLEDWGRGFDGHDGIRSWDSTDNIGVGMHFDLEAARQEGAEWLVSVEAKSERFNGAGKFRITLDGDRIARLIIRE